MTRPVLIEEEEPMNPQVPEFEFQISCVRICMKLQNLARGSGHLAPCDPVIP